MRNVYIRKIIKIFKKEYPHATIALKSSDLFQLLVAVQLSAQCTDERVNKVTLVLFRRFPDVADFAHCDLAELEKLIYSTGFYRNKARNIKGAALKILQEFNGKVPNNMKDLLSLPGVARKTANVILSAGFGGGEGIVVDTHVIRVSGRLGLVDMKLSKTKNAVKIEQKLMKILPKSVWRNFAYWLIIHGRKVCVARRPKCKICPLNKVCPSADLNY